MTKAVFLGVGSFIPVLVSMFAARGIFHLFQLESYQFPGFFRSVGRNPKQAWLPGIYAALVSLVLLSGLQAFYRAEQGGFVHWLLLAAFLLCAAGAGWLFARIQNGKKAKKPFVVTGRVKRLYTVTAILLGVFSVSLSTVDSIALTALWPVALPLLLAGCGFVAWGPEKLISEFYFRSARRKLLAQKDLIRIGITGSYGKTTVKHILGTLLAEKYQVLYTPKSFNTPMGVSRTIREMLLPAHQVFIAEMGARHVGDIKELCRLVKPEIGILTSVGPQHLDTFKTVERVASTKYELIAALPAEGRSFFADDHAICRALYQKTVKPRTLASLTAGDADVWSENVNVSPEGSAFTLCFADGQRYACQTRLLGEHNILNIVLAAAVARSLGLTKQQILRGVQRIEPVPSRLELIKNTNSYTIINDGFNANPIGAQAALNVLGQFPQRRIIVTPGMVELGAREAELNREFGRAIAKAADIAVIVGKKRVQPIMDGLAEAGFPAESTHRVDSLQESTALLQRLARAGDTVLYENDLPDNYQEH